MERTLSHIAALPGAAPLHPGVAEELIRVIAISHTRRRPSYWRARIG